MKNSQNIQISGSSGVSIGNLEQSINAGMRQAKDPATSAVKVLFMAANPFGTDRLRLDREVKAMADVFRTADGRFDLEQSWAITIHELQDGLLRYKPDIVHLSGHGRLDGRLVLEVDAPDRDLAAGSRRNQSVGSTAYLKALGNLFSATKVRTRCVVFNACHSVEAAEVVAENVDCAIGMSASINDEAAIVLTKAFYTALVHGQSVKAAFDGGVAQIALSGSLDGGVPRLVAQRCDPAEIFFRPVPSVQPED